MRRINLNKNKVALVDDADFGWLNHYRWSAQLDGRVWYAFRSSGGPKPHTIRMHQVIAAVMGFSRPDHKNGNGLDNRRENLRPASYAQQTMNQRKNASNTSGYKGVVWNRQRNNWQATIKLNDRRKYLGSFMDKKLAAAAYDKAAKEIFGEFANLNFPE